MTLDSRASEALRRAALAGETSKFNIDQFDEFTLAGLLEALASAVAVCDENPIADQFRLRAKDESSSAGECWRVWNRPGPPSWGSDIHGTRTVEFYRLRTRDDQINPSYQLFRQRFVRSLRTCGFAEDFAYAVAGAFGEMTDNVIQHSRSQPVGDFTGLAGYHATSGYFAFGVTDLGQGVLASLAKSPNWGHLRTPSEALREAVCANASCRPDQPYGEGFRTLFQSLVDRNGLLRFRSDDALLTLGDGGMHRQGIEKSSPPLRGLQMSVCCSIFGTASERAIQKRS